MIFVFNSVHSVIRAERLLREQGKACKVIPAPREISTECGMVLELATSESLQCHDLLTNAGLLFKEFDNDV